MGRHIGKDLHLCSYQDRKSLDGTPINALDWVGRNGPGPDRKAIWSDFNVKVA